MRHPLEGLLLLNKPQGPTSHDMVGRVRRAAGMRRVGHAGTLDPMASGLLPVVLGRATRLVRFLPDTPKCYSGSLRLGRTSDTDDATGEILARFDGPLPPAARVLAAARAMEGRLDQLPPAFSARRVEGQRMYALARKGVSVDAPTAAVEVFRFELQATAAPELYTFVAEVSPGTYIRALARDLGQVLGCGGLLASLTRTRVGPMRLEQAWDGLPDRTDRPAVQAVLIPLDRMPLTPPPLRLPDEESARRFLLGSAVSIAAVPSPQGVFRVEHPSGSLLGVGEGRDGGLQPRVVLPRD